MVGARESKGTLWFYIHAICSVRQLMFEVSLWLVFGSRKGHFGFYLKCPGVNRRQPPHICSRMQVGPFRNLLDMLEVCSSILLHICSGSRPSGHQAGGNQCIYAAQWRSPLFMQKVLHHFAAYMQWFPPVGPLSRREPLHICSRMEVAPFRNFLIMLNVCNCMPKQLS